MGLIRRIAGITGLRSFGRYYRPFAARNAGAIMTAAAQLQKKIAQRRAARGPQYPLIHSSVLSVPRVPRDRDRSFGALLQQIAARRQAMYQAQLNAIHRTRTMHKKSKQFRSLMDSVQAAKKAYLEAVEAHKKLQATKHTPKKLKDSEQAVQQAKAAAQAALNQLRAYWNSGPQRELDALGLGADILRAKQIRAQNASTVYNALSFGGLDTSRHARRAVRKFMRQDPGLLPVKIRQQSPDPKTLAIGRLLSLAPRFVAEPIYRTRLRNLLRTAP